VDLLKVDVERAELAVLRGLAPEDWPSVRQVALEAHGGGKRGAESGGDAALGDVRALLRRAGFADVAAEQDAALAGTNLYNLYAVRGAAAAV
jgi:31-O-methyltransferase